MPVILVALDGTEAATRALPVAAALARVADAAIHLAHVAPPPPGTLGGRAQWLGVADAVAAVRERAEEGLSGRAGGVDAQAPGPVTWETRDGADVAAELVQVAVERDALLVVMATRAAGTVSRLLTGSVADRVVRECPRPVALVPPGAEYPARADVRFERVLVPLDGSEVAERGLDFLLGLPRASTLEYVLMTVVPYEAEQADALARLDAAAQQVRARGARVETGVVVAPEPAAAIAATIRDALVDLVVMSTHGAGGLERLVLGSVAEGVVRASEVPVVLLTPKALGAA